MRAISRLNQASTQDRFGRGWAVCIYYTLAITAYIRLRLWRSFTHNVDSISFTKTAQWRNRRIAGTAILKCTPHSPAERPFADFSTSNRPLMILLVHSAVNFRASQHTSHPCNDAGKQGSKSTRVVLSRGLIYGRAWRVLATGKHNCATTRGNVGFVGL